MVLSRGGARNFPTEGLELPTGRLKRLKNGVSVRYFAKVPPTRTKIFSDGRAFIYIFFIFNSFKEGCPSTS